MQFDRSYPRSSSVPSNMAGLQVESGGLLINGTENASIVTTLAIFGAAAFRIMPSLTRIMNSIQLILYNRATVDSVYKEFKEEVSENNIDKNFSSKKSCFEQRNCT